MKIKLFGKIIELDEKNPGIDFFLNECCEFPTEAWVIMQYDCMTGNQKSEENIKKELSEMSVKQINSILEYGILDTLNTAETYIGTQLKDKIEHVKNAYQ